MNFSNANCGTTHRPALRTLAALLLASAALSGGTAAAATYHVVALPLPADAETGTVGVGGINNAGETVGSGRKSGDLDSHAVAWSAAPDYAPRWLPQRGADSSIARGINDAGYIVGDLDYPNRPVRSVAAMWRPDDVVIPLRNPPTAQVGSSAFAINGNGTILGNYDPGSGKPPIFWITPTSVHEFPYNPDGFFGSPDVEALNDSGVVVGNAYVKADRDTHGFRMTPGAGTQLLDDLPGFQDSYPQDVNEADEVAGYAYKRALAGFVLTSRAVLWNADGTVLDLGDLPDGELYEDGYFAHHINNARVVVGSAKDLDASIFATFVWTATTGMQNIVDLIDPLDPLYPRIASGELQIQINGLNDAGVMVGAAASTSESIPIVLVPQT